MPVAQGGPTPWNGGGVWTLDGLHGSQPDKTNEVVHFGARHILHRDGLWMQPEPMLAIGHILPEEIQPAALGGMYAGGNPLMFQDVTGYFTQNSDGSISDVTKSEGAKLNDIGSKTSSTGKEHGAMGYSKRDGKTGKIGSGVFVGKVHETTSSNPHEFTPDVSIMTADVDAASVALGVDAKAGDTLVPTAQLHGHDTAIGTPSQGPEGDVDQTSELGAGDTFSMVTVAGQASAGVRDVSVVGFTKAAASMPAPGPKMNGTSHASTKSYVNKMGGAYQSGTVTPSGVTVLSGP